MYIKYIILVFSLFVVFGNSMFAQTNDESNAIKALIDEVKQAQPSQRRLLMNELKVKLRSMQQTSRMQVMLSLRQSFNAEHTQMGAKQMQTNMHHQNTMSMTESKHMQEHMKMDVMTRGERSNGSGSSRPPRPGGLGNTPTSNMPERPNGQTGGSKSPSKPAGQAPQGQKPNANAPKKGI